MQHLQSYAFRATANPFWQMQLYFRGFSHDLYKGYWWIPWLNGRLGFARGTVPGSPLFYMWALHLATPYHAQVRRDYNLKQRATMTAPHTFTWGGRFRWQGPKHATGLQHQVGAGLARTVCVCAMIDLNSYCTCMTICLGGRQIVFTRLHTFLRLLLVGQRL